MRPDETADILILGGSGQVGTAVMSQRWPRNVRLHAPPRSLLGITNDQAITQTIASHKWSCVINCAAYTAVDAAETGDPDVWRVNALGPGLLAAATAKAATPIIHLSTDYVFDGLTKAPYQPSDPVHPINAYGNSKAEGEARVRRENPCHIILRTSWIVSSFRTNFVKTILHLANQRDRLEVVNDQTSRLTSAIDLAAALQVISLRLISDPLCPTGTYHFANAGSTTWYDVALATMLGARRRGARAVPVEAISTSTFQAKARRPPRSELCTDKLSRDFAIEPRPWQAALEDILDALLPPGRGGQGK